MIIHSAEFVISNSDHKKCPDSLLPEYAFIGRSNVGKSSLINMLTNNRKLAMTSSKPGKTQLINHFLINKAWHLVDLPGYGYAQTDKKTKAGFTKIITEYLLKRKQLTCLFILVDARHPELDKDHEFIAWAGSQNIPLSIILTKADKISPATLKLHRLKLQERLNTYWEQLPPIFISSSNKKRGKDEILLYIDEINKSL